MQNLSIDQFDAAILDALQRDAGLTNAELSAVTNLSPSQCSRRRAALEAADLITGYRASLNAEALGFGLRAVTRVNLRLHSESNDEAFGDFLNRHEEVRCAYSVSGDADYVLELHVRDLAAFAEFIHRELLPHPQVAQVRSEIVLTTLKEDRGVPLKQT